MPDAFPEIGASAGGRVCRHAGLPGAGGAAEGGGRAEGVPHAGPRPAAAQGGRAEGQADRRGIRGRGRRRAEGGRQGGAGAAQPGPTGARPDGPVPGGASQAAQARAAELEVQLADALAALDDHEQHGKRNGGGLAGLASKVPRSVSVEVRESHNAAVKAVQ
eukprot:scaffold116213_cov38-Prasinocladus_malaysianus.AAC.1